MKVDDLRFFEVLEAAQLRKDRDELVNLALACIFHQATSMVKLLPHPIMKLNASSTVDHVREIIINLSPESEEKGTLHPTAYARLTHIRTLAEMISADGRTLGERLDEEEGKKGT
jgi:hypothetical protein